ncbi:MAG: carbonate dehydratase [Microscillaceae bacterium]|nr:carbonate dehydratase [Microscillaceae bacterium]
MKTYEKLLLQNKAWVKERLETDANFFKRLADIQKPEFLWIGCSDSRVPANEITGTDPGEMFVHRNIANMVVHTDLNMLSVLQYAVEVLGVKHVIVCGHYGCGGVRAAMSQQELGLINQWLRNIKDVYRFHRTELEMIEDEDAQVNLLVELNVKEQVLNLAKNSIIQKAWKKNNQPTLHGWVYGLKNGILKDICIIKPDIKMDDIYMFDLNSPEE